LCRALPVVALILAAASGCVAPEAESMRPASSTFTHSAGTNRAARTHTVAPGETVYHIAHEYGLSPQRLMAANNLSDPRNLDVGQVLTIPGDSFGSASAIVEPDIWSAPRAERQFAWPVVAGTVSSPFGIRHGVMHDGIDIAAPAGTPVRSADAGSVIYAGQLHGYGNVVIVQHHDGYATVYGHNQRNLVGVGDQVLRGQEIAEIGTTGRTSGGANLHFEVRRNNHPQNPIAYLPTPDPSSGISFARNTTY
jgi:murein DD-endopeptidase MepM/ murein hydrolase activator NlpD